MSDRVGLVTGAGSARSGRALAMPHEHDWFKNLSAPKTQLLARPLCRGHDPSAQRHDIESLVPVFNRGVWRRSCSAHSTQSSTCHNTSHWH